MEYAIFTITTNDAFNYFFSIPMWILILSVPMLLAFSAFKHLK